MIVRIRMRIYRMHDYDLCVLRNVSDVNFNNTVKAVLRSYIQGKFYRISLPDIPSVKVPNADLPYVQNFQIEFDSEKDKDILDFLATIHDGHVNGFVKNVLRSYMCFSLLPEYVGDEVAKEKCKKTKISIAEEVPCFRKGKENRKIKEISGHKAKETGEKKQTKQTKPAKQVKEEIKEEAVEIKPVIEKTEEIVNESVKKEPESVPEAKTEIKVPVSISPALISTTPEADTDKEISEENVLEMNQAGFDFFSGLLN